MNAIFARSLLIVTLIWSYAEAKTEIIPIPGKGWHVEVDVPTILQKEGSPRGDDYVFQANSGRFNMSLFVEKPNGRGSHEQCFEYYWPMGKRNPMIDQSSVQISHTDKYYRVEYMISGEHEGQKVTQKNVNYYFVFNRKWMDLHISIVFPEPGDEETLRRFDAGFKYANDDASGTLSISRLHKTKKTHSAEEIKLDTDKSIFITPKAGWTLQRMKSHPGYPARTVHVYRAGYKIMITIIGSDNGVPVNKSTEELSQLVNQTSMQYAPTSVEGRINLKDISLKNIKGSYACFTDSKWKDKTPPAGEYVCVTNGAFIASGTIVAVTYLSSDLNSDVYFEGLQIIKSLVGNS